MTPEMKTREEWEKQVGSLSVKYRDFAFAEVGLGESLEDENQCWDKYAQEKSAMVDAIMSLQTELATAKAEVERLEKNIAEVASGFVSAHMLINDLDRFVMEVDGQHGSFNSCVVCARHKPLGHLENCSLQKSKEAIAKYRSSEKPRQPK